MDLLFKFHGKSKVSISTKCTSMLIPAALRNRKPDVYIQAQGKLNNILVWIFEKRNFSCSKELIYCVRFLILQNREWFVGQGLAE
jgi:hypothetical protein